MPGGFCISKKQADGQADAIKGNSDIKDRLDKMQAESTTLLILAPQFRQTFTKALVDQDATTRLTVLSFDENDVALVRKSINYMYTTAHAYVKRARRDLVATGQTLLRKAKKIAGDVYAEARKKKLDGILSDFLADKLTSLSIDTMKVFPGVAQDLALVGNPRYPTIQEGERGNILLLITTKIDSVDKQNVADANIALEALTRCDAIFTDVSVFVSNGLTRYLGELATAADAVAVAAVKTEINKLEPMSFAANEASCVMACLFIMANSVRNTLPLKPEDDAFAKLVNMGMQWFIDEVDGKSRLLETAKSGVPPPVDAAVSAAQKDYDAAVEDLSSMRRKNTDALTIATYLLYPRNPDVLMMLCELCFACDIPFGILFAAFKMVHVKDPRNLDTFMMLAPHRTFKPHSNNPDATLAAVQKFINDRDAVKGSSDLGSAWRKDPRGPPIL